MTQRSETASTIEHGGEIAKLLEAMSQPGGVSLTFDGEEAAPAEVLLAEVHTGERLVIDVTAAPEVVESLLGECSFSLVGQAHGAMVVTEPLTATALGDIPGRLRFGCHWPERLDVWQRRSAFRAELGNGLGVGVEVETQSYDVIHGELVNLSLGGCLIQLPLSKASELEQGQPLPRVEAVFPSGQRFAARGEVRHVRIDEGWESALVGCEFSPATARFERLIWFLVQEIEREGVRKASGRRDSLNPSPLFQGAPAALAPSPGRRHQAGYATPMTRRLAGVADYLNAQLVKLQQGEEIDSSLLSDYTARLLSLHEEDREALLFASVCLHQEPQLVQHGLAVAIRLADMGRARNAPRELLRTMVATAMVHDLGKALLPDSLCESPTFDDAKRERLASHVDLLRERLGNCRWLSPQVVKSVIGEVNERIDGSGYPAGLGAEELSALSRMVTVVDVVDAMSRPRPDRAARTARDIYRHLLTHGRAFDGEWVQRYISHFGMVPIGSLVRYANGQLAWVQGLDRKGEPRQVQLAETDSQPDNRLGAVLRDAEMARLGKLEALVVPKAKEGG